METRPPTAARILIAAGFALSCFALALFLWLAFGGPIPLKPEGYRFEVPFDEATQLAQEADVRISGRLGRQGEADRARRRGGRGGDGRARRAVRTDALGHEGDPPRRRRCSARPTSSSPPAARRPSPCPRAVNCRARRWLSRCSSTRSSGRSTTAPGPRSASGCRVRREPFAVGATTCRSPSPRSTRSRPRPMTRYASSTASTRRSGACCPAAPRCSARCPSARASSPA